MKIGKLEVSYRMFIYLGLMVVGVIGISVLWRSNSEVRAESIYRDRILKGLYDDRKEVLAEAIVTAQDVAASNPQRVECRLYLGSLLYRQKEYSAAQKAFEEASSLSGATPRQKTWALVGAGSSCFSQAAKTPTDKTAMEKATVAAEKFFRSALEIKIDGKPSVDAQASMALLTYAKGGAPATLATTKEAIAKETMGWVDQVDLSMASESVPSLKIMAQVLNVRGLCLSALRRNAESLASFTQAMIIRPDRTDFADNRRLLSLNTISDPKLSDIQRLDLLQKIEKEILLYGKQQAVAWNYLGQAYAAMKSSENYIKGPYAQATNAFLQIIRLDPKDLKGYRILGMFLEDRIADVAKTLKSPISGLKGETPIPTMWGNGPTQRFSAADGNTISELNGLLMKADAHWFATAERAEAVADKVDFKLRQLSAQRRQYWLTRDNDVKPKMMEKMQKLSAEIIALDDKNSFAHFVAGLLCIERSDYTGALVSMTAAKEKGMTTPDLDRMLSDLSFKPQVLNAHPAIGRRWFGTVPLISASLRTVSQDYKSVKMQVDGKDVQPTLSGTQCLFVPDESAASDGTHSVKIAVVDKHNSVIEFPEVSFGIDKKAPTIKITPDAGEISNKQVWTITVSDPSGIDIPSTFVLFKTIKAAIPVTRELVKEGKYKMGFPDVDPMIKAAALIAETFKVTVGQELQPGEYSLTITCSDSNGNAGSETKTFSVK